MWGVIALVAPNSPELRVEVGFQREGGWEQSFHGESQALYPRPRWVGKYRQIKCSRQMNGCLLHFNALTSQM